MKIEKTKLKEIFDKVSNENGYIDFPEYHTLLEDILNMSKTEEVFITREQFQEMTRNIMDTFKDTDMTTFMKIVILAYLDSNIFSKKS